MPDKRRRRCRQAEDVLPAAISPPGDRAFTEL